MTARPILLILCLGVAAPVVGCATTQMAGEQWDDTSITTRVATRLAVDLDVRKTKIDVDTLERVVTLRGNVENETEKRKAEAIARNTRGVVAVVNKLKVGTNADLDDGNPDKLITFNVKRELFNDENVQALNVDVDTDDRVVTLSGIVQTESNKRDAERVARNVNGVKDVINELQIDQN